MSCKRVPLKNNRLKKSDSRVHYEAHVTVWEWARPDSNRRPPPCNGELDCSVGQSEGAFAHYQMLSSYPTTGNHLNLLELNFNLEELQSFNESRKVGLAKKSISWIDTSSDLIWEILMCHRLSPPLRSEPFAVDMWIESLT